MKPLRPMPPHFCHIINNSSLAVVKLREKYVKWSGGEGKYELTLFLLTLDSILFSSVSLPLVSAFNFYNGNF